MEMELDGNKFWIVRDTENEEMRLYDGMEQSVKRVKQLMDEEDRESETIDLLEAELEGEEAKFTAVSWGKIAQHLVDLE